VFVGFILLVADIIHLSDGLQNIVVGIGNVVEDSFQCVEDVLVFGDGEGVDLHKDL
jgi:hypothetical protein